MPHGRWSPHCFRRSRAGATDDTALHRDPPWVCFGWPNPHYPRGPERIALVIAISFPQISERFFVFRQSRLCNTVRNLGSLLPDVAFCQELLQILKSFRKGIPPVAFARVDSRSVLRALLCRIIYHFCQPALDALMQPEMLR